MKFPVRFVFVAFFALCVAGIMACVEQDKDNLGQTGQSATSWEEAKKRIEIAYSGGTLGYPTVTPPFEPKDSKHVDEDIWAHDYSSTTAKQVCDWSTRHFQTEVNFGVLCYRLYAFCCETIYPYPHSPPYGHCDDMKLDCWPYVW